MTDGNTRQQRKEVVLCNKLCKWTKDNIYTKELLRESIVRIGVDGLPEIYKHGQRIRQHKKTINAGGSCIS